jgi:hypothetical protein
MGWAQSVSVEGEAVVAPGAHIRLYILIVFGSRAR